MIVSEEIKQERLNTCKQCPYKRDNFTLFGIVIFKRELQCSACKCFLQVKTKLTDSQCPFNKWEK
jgi:hypothetical protein